MDSNLIQLISVISQSATVIGIFLLYRQIEIGRKTAQVQLIHELEKEFSSFGLIFSKIKPGGAWHDQAELTVEDIAQLENLVSFCEKLKHFLDRKVLNWETLDLMFRNRFFLIMHNVNVVNLVVKPYQSDWSVAVCLEKEWRERLPESDTRRYAIILKDESVSK